jgi:hypothetical protein
MATSQGEGSQDTLENGPSQGAGSIGKQVVDIGKSCAVVTTQRRAVQRLLVNHSPTSAA